MSEPTAMSRSSEYTGPPASSREVVDDGMPTTQKRRRLTNSAHTPALRLNRPVARRPTEKRQVASYTTTAPAHLRFIRMFMGLALLAAAWGCILLVVALVESLAAGLPQVHVGMGIRVLLWALGACGMLWLSVISIALIIVGAFSLTLSLARRKW